MHQFVPIFKARYLVLFPFLLMLISSTHLFSQAVAFCGIDGDVGEEVAFVALRDLAPGEQIFITEDEYSDFTNEFESNEGHIVYTAPAGGLAENSVVVISETSAQVFTITGGGTVAAVGTGDWSFSNQDEMYAYSASNPSSPWNSVTEVHCFLWTSVVAPPADQLLDNDWPNAITIAFNIGGPGGVNANFNDAARVNTTLAMLLDGANWTTSTGNVDLSPTNFTNQMIASSGCTPTLNGLNVTVCPDTPTGQFTIEADGELNGADAWYIKLVQGGETCGTFTASGGFAFTGSFSNSFTLPDSEYVVFAVGDCITEQVCYIFTPRGLFGIPSFSLATTTYNELDGIQTNLGGATPSGGTYSGPGVTDDGNGMTFSFDPAAAGVGNHSITYTTGTNSGACSNLSTSVSVTVVAPSITFPALGTVCEGSGVQTITGGATPVGGVYSGTGVTDGGNGTTFSFDPSITGVGSTSVNYAIGSSTASSTLTVAALPTVTFTSSLSTIGVDGGIQTGVSGGSPAGGVYSGPGVTDNGNGMTFTFDPAAAGAGEVIVTYTFTDGNGCSNNQSDVITVEAAPCAPMFTGVEITDCSEGADGFVSYRVIGELSGAAQWQWYGPGNCTEGDLISSGETVNAIFFFPSQTHYIVATGGCLTEPLCFEWIPNEVLGVATFTLATTSYCSDAGVQTGLGGGTPTGGTYSGPGVTDDGNGMTFSFDPAAAGAGSVTYSVDAGTPCGESSASVNVSVFALPTVTFTSSLSNVNEDAGLQTSISGGSPAGGIYSGPGVTDDGNGLSFSFDPAAAGAGEVIVTYTFTDGNGCSNNQSDVITVEAVQLPGDICPDAIDINVLFTGPLNEAVVSTTQDNTGYNADNDPGAGYDCWFGDAPVLNNTIWYAFTGDGEKYSIRSIACGDNAMTNTDTQFALYSGDCTTPVAVACNDDEDFDNAVYNSYLEIVTEPGVEYLLMVDGYVAAADYEAIGSFCLEVTLLESVGVTDLANTDLVVYPNPTNGEIQLPQIDMERVEVYNATGQLVVKRTTVERTIDLAAQPAGLYLLKIYADGVVYSAKVVKQ